MMPESVRSGILFNKRDLASNRKKAECGLKHTKPSKVSLNYGENTFATKKPLMTSKEKKMKFFGNEADQTPRVRNIKNGPKAGLMTYRSGGKTTEIGGVLPTRSLIT